MNIIMEIQIWNCGECGELFEKLIRPCLMAVVESHRIFFVDHQYNNTKRTATIKWEAFV